MAKVTVVANSKTQEITVEVEGVVGQSCTDITKQFEEAMGMTTTSQKKREFYQETENQAYN